MTPTGGERVGGDGGAAITGGVGGEEGEMDGRGGGVRGDIDGAEMRRGLGQMLWGCV